MAERQIIVIAHNIRSAHNIGSLLRNCDGFGVNMVYFSGFTPYPKKKNDNRLPHVIARADKKIKKTALGAETSVKWEYTENIKDIIDKLRKKHYRIAVLEQHNDSQMIKDYRPYNKTALILGNEINGIDKEIINEADDIVEIPMLGKKESFNVTHAAAIAIYRLRFYN